MRNLFKYFFLFYFLYDIEPTESRSYPPTTMFGVFIVREKGREGGGDLVVVWYVSTVESSLFVSLLFGLVQDL